VTTEPVDVLVVGAGPTGLALALQAADHGASVRVVERRQELFRPSRALIMHPRTLEVLRPLGVSDALLARGDRSPSVDLHLRRRVVHARLDNLALRDTPFPYLALIRQAAVEAILSDAFASRGGHVELGKEVTRVVAASDRARATLADGREIECRFAVGCDGPASAVRTAMNTTWRGGRYRQDVVLADLELAGDLEPRVAHATPSPEGVVLLFPLGERATWRLLATRPRGVTDASIAQTAAQVPEKELRAIVHQSGLADDVTKVAWSARVPIQHRIAGAYRFGTVFVAGDAAHTHSPAGGQGMNTGIQDATNLGWKLAFAARSGHTNASAATLLDSYELERRPVARHVLTATNLLFWAEAGTDVLARTARTVVATAGAPVLPWLLRWRSLTATGARTLGQLRVNYRHSPLSCNGQRTRDGFPQAGSRLRDAPVIAAGGASRLHDLLAHPGIGLLLQRDVRSSAIEAVPGIVRTHRLTSCPGTGVAAIRPDGYIGFSGDATELRELNRWLELVCPSAVRDHRS
jgi:2-polyprenyl-6-methoxyphenol hydroxylase-like FAD-dependent oxidoreductase